MPSHTLSSILERFPFRKPKTDQSERGREIPDPTPMAPPVGFKPAPSLADQIREMVRSERLAREVAEAGYETFEEADDFDVGDDFDPSTPYEESFDKEGRSSFTPISEVNKQEDAANKARREKPTPPPEPKPSDPPKAEQTKEPAKPAGDHAESPAKK